MIKPKAAFLEITQKCNLQCRHCYLSSKDMVSKDLPTEKWFLIMDKLKEMGIKYVTLFGGEPTLRNDLYDILQYAINNFDVCTVETNGTTISSFNNYDCIVSVSLEYLDQKKNDEIRGKVKIGDNEISPFHLAIKKLMGLKNQKICRYSIYSDNDPLSFAYFAERIGANSVGVPLKTVGLGVKLKNKVPSAKKLLDDYKNISLFNKKTRFNHMIEDCQYYIFDKKLFEKYSGLFLKRKRICAAGIYRIYINHKGDCSPCMFIPQFKMGNLLKDKIKIILNNIEDWIKKIDSYPVGGKCARCIFVNICNGGCIANWIGYNIKNGFNCPI